MYSAIVVAVLFRCVHQTSSLKSHPTLVLLGDSTMRRAATALSSILDNCTLVQNGSRCDFSAYCGMAYYDTALKVTIPQHEGPVMYGKDKRGCQDCSSCEPNRWKCSGIDVEYLGIEFAADVEYPTLNHSTTQESIILGYLKKTARIGDFVVFNTGIHDTVNTGAAPLIYAQQLGHYVDMLLEVYASTNIIWLTSTYPKDRLQRRRWRSITSTKVVSILNDASRLVMSKRGIQVLDVAPLSNFKHFDALFVGAIHICNETQAWYRSVAFSVLVQLSNNMIS